MKRIIPTRILLLIIIVTIALLSYYTLSQKRSDENNIQLKTYWPTVDWRTNTPEIVGFDSNNDYVFIMDTHNRILMANKAFYSALGLKKEDVVGKTCFSFLHGKDTYVSSCPYLETIKTKSPSTKIMFEPLFNKTMLMSTIPVFDYDGAIKQVIHYCKLLSQEEISQYSVERQEITV